MVRYILPLLIAGMPLVVSPCAAQQDEVCLGCHQEWYEQKIFRNNAHGPFREARCTLCHQGDFSGSTLKARTAPPAGTYKEKAWKITREILPGRHVLPLPVNWPGHPVDIETKGLHGPGGESMRLDYPDPGTLPTIAAKPSPAVITDLGVTSVNRGVILRATIEWSTSAPTMGTLWCKGEDGIHQMMREQHYGTSHRLEVAGLKAGRSYRISVRAKDLFGREFSSREHVFETDGRKHDPSPISNTWAVPGTGKTAVRLKLLRGNPVLEVQCVEPLLLKVRQTKTMEAGPKADNVTLSPEPSREGHPGLLAKRRTGLTVCVRCHPDTVHPGYNHPVDVPPTRQMRPPQDYSLPEGVMVCTSCHDPHGVANAFLLRRSGDSLCGGCHPLDAYGGSDLPQPTLAKKNRKYW